MTLYDRMLTTLRRLPDDVILSMATRPIELEAPYECVCGWAAREVIAREQHRDVDDTVGCFVTAVLAERFGGDEEAEWTTINHAYSDSLEALTLEDAFTDRVLECVGA